MSDKTKIADIRKMLLDNGTDLLATMQAAREALMRGDIKAAQASTERCDALLRERDAHNQLITREIADLLRRHLADPHAQRRTAVIVARSMRITYGVRSNKFRDAWATVEEFAGRIKHFASQLQTVEDQAVPQGEIPR